jgi:hypothetical protein
VVAAATLTTAAQLVETGAGASEAQALIPTPAEPPEIYDLNDMLTDAALPTVNLITIQIGTDGTASLALPRTEVGQGITNSSAMLVAEELDLPLGMVRVSLADVRPELVFNQLTGGSNTTISTYQPIRVGAALARGRLLQAAATALGERLTTLTSAAGVVTAANSASVSYGQLAKAAASLSTVQTSVTLKTADAALAGPDFYDNFPHQALVVSPFDLTRHRPPQTGRIPHRGAGARRSRPTLGRLLRRLPAPRRADAGRGPDRHRAGPLLPPRGALRGPAPADGLPHARVHPGAPVALRAADHRLRGGAGPALRKEAATDPFYDGGGQRTLLQRLELVKHEFLAGTWPSPR